MIPQIGKQLCCLKDSLLPQSLNYFKGVMMDIIKTKERKMKEKHKSLKVVDENYVK